MRDHNRRPLIFLFTLLVVAAGAVPASAGEVVLDNDFITGLSAPLAVGAPDGDDRVFVAEVGGKIKIFDSTTGAPIGTFLDVGPGGEDLITAGGEQGLLGLAFHPDYATNGKFYLHYIDRVTTPGDVHIVEFTVSADPDVADPSSYRLLLAIPEPRSNHNGGTVAFGSDGHLYISVGDGGKQTDPDNNGQRTDTLLGKILRIDVDGGTPYAIPDGNPYQGGGGLPEIWSLGLRNPFRMSFDEDTGDLYIGDVGQVAKEEVNAVGPAHAAANFGWNILEGSICQPPATSCSAPPGYVPPIHDYDRTSTSRSVIGGYVYRGQVLPSLDGVYFYTDFYTDSLWSLRYTGGTGGSVSDHTNWQPILGPISNVAGFGTDGHGELYLASFGGNVSKLVSPVDRHWGLDRYETAAEISARAFPSASTVYVATGEAFPDALAAAAAAAEAGGPVLLVRPNSIPGATTDELTRLGPSKIVVVGGTGAVSANVVTALETYAPSVERHGGSDRYATAAIVSAQAFLSASTAYVATGENFPDATSAAAAAAQAGGPVLLVRSNSIPAETANELTRLGPSKIVVVGGTGVISAAVVTGLEAYAPTVERHWGVDRYQTAANTSAQAFSSASTVYVATGENFPDALTAAAAAAQADGPVLLVRSNSIPATTAAELTRLSPSTIVIVGGPGAISYGAQSSLAAFLP